MSVAPRVPIGPGAFDPNAPCFAVLDATGRVKAFGEGQASFFAQQLTLMNAVQITQAQYVALNTMTAWTLANGTLTPA